MNIHIGETYTYMYMEICKCTKSHADIPVSFYYICKSILTWKYFKHETLQIDQIDVFCFRIFPISPILLFLFIVDPGSSSRLLTS